MKNWLAGIVVTATSVQMAFAAIVSSPSQATVSAGGNSFNPIFSADGQHLVFVSHANNLVTNDDLGLWLDVFVRGLVSSNTVLVSVSTNGTGGANSDANYPSISSNGQFVAFASRASNLVPGDSNGAIDVFVRDVVAGTTRLVSVDVSGSAPIDSAPSSIIPLSGHPLISADGRWVFFESRATNLIAGGASLNSVNIYVRDTWANVTELITVDTNGSAIAGSSTLASITPDGRYVAFVSADPSLAPANNNLGSDVYVRDQQIGSTLLASTNVSALLGGNYVCSFPVLAGQGAGVAFNATVTASGVTYPLFFDLQSGLPQRFFSFAISNRAPVISADGSAVAFAASSNGWTQILLWKRASNAVFVAHEKQFGNFPSSPSHVDFLSTDARFMVFREIGVDSPYFTTNFVPRYHLFRKDLDSGVLELLSANTNQAAGSADFQFSALTASSGAGLIAFDSTANDLATQDLNGLSDIFLRDVNAGVTELITKAVPSRPAATAFAHSFLGPNSVSADGRFIASTRYDDPSVFRDTNGWVDVFVTDTLLGATRALSLDTNLYTPAQGGTLPGPDGLFYRENTNAFAGAIISADGSTVAAGILRPGSTGLPGDIYWARASNGVFGTGMSLANRTDNPSGSTSGNGRCYNPSLSPDGRDVAFTTASIDFVFTNGNDNNFVPDVVLRRTAVGSNGLVTGANYLVSVGLSGNAGNNWSSNGIISPDGRWVIFESMATDLVTNDSGSVLKLFARDLWSNATHLISVQTFPNYSIWPGSARFSGDARRVTFTRGLYSPDDLYVHDLLARTNMQANRFPNTECCYFLAPSLNGDGRLVAYVLLPNNSSDPGELRVRDLHTGQSELLMPLPRSFWYLASFEPAISVDGRHVVLRQFAGNIPSHTNQILVHDRLLGSTLFVSVNSMGQPGNGPSTQPVLAADGRTVVFQSFASDLAAGDFNDKRDVFVLKLGGADSDGDGMDDDWEMAYFETLTRNGTGDFDGDGTSDKAEFLAGTDPTNANSVFRVLTVTPAGGGARTLFWSGNPARTYRAEFKDDIGAAGWTALTGAVSWNGSTASIPDPTAGSAPNRFYRVLRLP